MTIFESWCDAARVGVKLFKITLLVYAWKLLSRWSRISASGLSVDIVTNVRVLQRTHTLFTYWEFQLLCNALFLFCFQRVSPICRPETQWSNCINTFPIGMGSPLLRKRWYLFCKGKFISKVPNNPFLSSLYICSTQDTSAIVTLSWRLYHTPALPYKDTQGRFTYTVTHFLARFISTLFKSNLYF